MQHFYSLRWGGIRQTPAEPGTAAKARNLPESRQ
jgi:hypothetical protein